MGNPEIIRQLKENPSLNVYALSLKIGVSTYLIGEAQHHHLAEKLASSRNSPMWNLPGYAKDSRPWLSKQKFEESLARINAGEAGVYESVSGAYRINKDYRDQLKGLK